MFEKVLKVFLRLAVAAGFLSAVGDRFGMWDASVTVWGHWDSFVAYTGSINPWFPQSALNFISYLSTVGEIVLSIMLLIGYKTKWASILSGVLLILFALAMSLSSPLGIKRAFDASVFTAAGAAFAISFIKSHLLEIDGLLRKNRSKNKYDNLSWTKDNI